MFYNSINNLVYIMVFTLFLGLVSALPAEADDDEAIAKEIILILKASRAVVVQNKPLIKNPRGAGISAGKFMELTLANYAKASGKPYAKGSGAMGDAQGKLMDAIRDVVYNVVSGKDKELDPQGRFLPAIFARKATARVGETSGGKMYLRLTTRDDYIVNAANKADAWKKGVIDGKFMGGGWEKGKTFSKLLITMARKRSG